MAGPLTLKASAFPATATTMEGVEELTDAEIKDHIAYIITKDFADNTDGTGAAELISTTGSLASGYTSIGTFTNRERNEAVGTHVAGGATTNTTYTMGQKTDAASVSTSTRPVRWNGSSVEEASDAEIDSEILDKVINAMVTEDANTIGQYHLNSGTPSGGTWTTRYTITETQVDGTDVAYKIWQKTAATTVPSSDTNRPLKVDTDGDLLEMTDAEIRDMTDRFRNRILSEGPGKYLLNAGAPSATGTWVQMGITMTDQLKDITDVSYSGSYTGNFSGTYSHNLSGTYAGSYTGSYTGYYNRFFGGYLNGAYAGTYSGSYTGYYTGYYTGNFTGTYSQSFTGSYTGATVQSSSSTQETKQLFIRTA